MSDRRFDYHMWASMTRFIRAAANDHTDSSLAEFGIVECFADGIKLEDFIGLGRTPLPTEVSRSVRIGENRCSHSVKRESKPSECLAPVSFA